MIVPGHPSDIIPLMRIEQHAFPVDGYDIFIMQKLIKNSLVFLKLVRPIDMEIVGFIICSNMEGDERAEYIRAAELVSIAIDPEYQGQGFGQRLLQDALIELKAKKVQLIRLQVKTNNENAIKLYTKFGFRIIEKLAHYYDESKDDAYLMVWVNSERT